MTGRGNLGNSSRGRGGSRGRGASKVVQGEEEVGQRMVQVLVGDQMGIHLTAIVKVKVRVRGKLVR